MRNTENIKDPVYTTGDTVPPKSRGGIVAVLLILVIVLSGAVSILGLMNISLFRALMSQEEDPAVLAFETAAAAPATASWQQARQISTQEENQAALGMLCREITAFYGECYNVPQGMYVSVVDDQSSCYRNGVRAGDIILTIDDVPMTSFEALRTAISGKSAGDTVCFTVYRKGSHCQICVTLPGD